MATSKEIVPKNVILKPIPDYPGYDAGSDGHIYSRKTHSGIANSVQKRLKSGLQGNKKYRIVILRQNGKSRTRTIHKLICTAFHGTPRPKLTASHIDGNRMNNRPLNLCWETQSANCKRKVKHGTDDSGHKNTRAMFTTRHIRAIRKRCASGETEKDIAKDYGCAQQTISKIKIGEHYART